MCNYWRPELRSIFPRSCVALARKVASCLESKMSQPQKLCGSCREGGWLSGAEDGAAPESLRLSRPSQKRLALCIPHGHPCSLPSAESWSQGDSCCQGLRHKPLGLADHILHISENLPSGVYLLRIQTDQWTVNKMIIKQ